MLHARAGMYRLTPPVVARRAPQLSVHATEVQRAVWCSPAAPDDGESPFLPRFLVVSRPSRCFRLGADLVVTASPVTDGTPLGV